MGIAKTISSMTAALRYDGELNVDMNEFQTNLVPFPRLHFMTTSLAPLVNEKKKERQSNNCWDLTEEALDAKSFLVKYVDFAQLKTNTWPSPSTTEVRSNPRKPTRPSKRSRRPQKSPSSSGCQLVSRLV